MHILGINVYHPDVSAVLIRDGQLIAALEEERFRRVKHYAGFPSTAIRRCLEIGGIEGKDLDAIAVSRNPKANLLRKTAFVLTHRPARTLLGDRFRNLRKFQDLKTPLADALSVTVEKLPKIRHVEHHPAHLASAFFVSPFEEAAVCALDGFGDFVSTSMAVGKDRRLKVLEKVCFPHSLGMLYTAVTQYLGFLSYGDEFKVMGLAPYGKPNFVNALSRLVRLKPGGLFELDLKYFRHWSDGVAMQWEDGYPSLGKVFSPELERLLGPARHPQEPLTERHEDIARSLQAVYETCAFHVLNALWERTKLPNLCLAGGCAMNSVANGKVRTHTPFRELYVQPAASDNGTALGAAYFLWHQSLGKPRTFVMDHALWGTSYENFNIESLLSRNGHNKGDFQVRRFSNTEETCRATARLLAEGNVIGWFQGRMEWGARALGNRSILADPRRADMRELINSKIKFREKFRPFAPSILEEAIQDYFVGDAVEPFMQQVYPIRDDKRALLPAIAHVDGTGRLQTVNRNQNPRYYRLIQEFEKLTGVPVLLNTSFNENEPIVDTPAQALDCFLRTKMDGIVADDTLILREPANLDPCVKDSSKSHHIEPVIHR
ncbi:MAG: carbamoyltransferase [Acidobacteria bacterium]|nr:MAG: carbamoyltransferase [Acidobacteriota bacterium]